MPARQPGGLSLSDYRRVREGIRFDQRGACRGANVEAAALAQ